MPDTGSKITYRINFRDYLALSGYLMSHNLMIGLITIGYYAGLNISSIIPGLPKNDSLAVQIVYLVFSEIIATISLVAIWLVILCITWFYSKGKLMAAERTLTWDKNGLTFESKFGRSELKWTIIYKLARTKNYTWLLLSKTNVIIIPSRAFARPTDSDQFYDFCRRQVQAQSGGKG